VAGGGLVAPAAWGHGKGVRLAIIVGPNSPLQDLDLDELRRLFGGDPVADPSGRGLIAFNHPPRSPDRIGFDQRVLGMDPERVNKYWIDRRIRAQPGPPRTATSVRMLVAVVARLPGAIGYVRREYVTGEVRVIKVSGRAPDMPGYPLVIPG
jgi:ABC-type phosphate transport system substrate-binding protein